MKKYVKSKNIQRIAATAIVLLLALAPYASARDAQYIKNVANVNTSISEVTNTEADNLFIQLMNEMYPVGSVYMTTDIATAGDMTDQFGGVWAPWGQGSVPVGAGGDFAQGATGGSKGGTQSTTVTMNDLAIDADGITITPGNVTPGAGGGVTYDGGSVALSGSQAAWSFSERLTAGTMPRHNHGVVITTGHLSKNYDSQATNMWSDPGSGTYEIPRTWSVTIDNAGHATPNPFGGTMTTALDVSANYFSAYIRSFPFSYTRPDTFYTPDTVSHNLAVSAVGTVTISDSTLQPYITCYMYERVALADFN